MDKRKQLKQSLAYYMMLHTKHQRFLKKIERPNYFKTVIEELKQKIIELENEV